MCADDHIVVDDKCSALMNPLRVCLVLCVSGYFHTVILLSANILMFPWHRMLSFHDFSFCLLEDFAFVSSYVCVSMEFVKDVGDRCFWFLKWQSVWFGIKCTDGVCEARHLYSFRFWHACRAVRQAPLFAFYLGFELQVQVNIHYPWMRCSIQLQISL